jgi:hypothetical protein
MVDINKIAYRVRESGGHAWWDGFYGEFKTKAKAISAARKLKKKYPSRKYRVEKWNKKDWIGAGFTI